MKSRTVLGLAIVAALLVTSPGIHAQLGGLLKKKAGEVIKGKPAPTETAPAPAPAPEPAEPAAPGAPATPATPASKAPAKAEPAASADPLAVESLSLTSNVNEYVRDEYPAPSGEWSKVPFFSAATRAALILLDDAGRVAFVEKTGPAIKALVQSEAYAKAHADYIQKTFDAVDHGLKGVMGMDALMKKQDFAGVEAYGKRQQSLNIVNSLEKQSAADIQRALGFELDMWRSSAKGSTGATQAKYQRFVKEGEAMVALGTSDETKLRRSYAVLKSIDIDGPDTADALYAMAAKARQENQQMAWDTHNLRTVLKQQLAAFIAIAPTVDFAAETVQKDRREKFVKPAYEKKGAIWKACYRAGEPATMAARQFAQGWLKELQ